VHSTPRRDADWQVQALEKGKQSEQASRRYYANLIANGLNAHENGYVDVSMDDRAAANVVEGIAEVMDLIPDSFVGTVDFMLVAASEGATFRGPLRAPDQGAFPSFWMVPERSSPSRVRFAAPNNGAPLTAPGRSEANRLSRGKGST
jgi:hypothetical protein